MGVLALFLLSGLAALVLEVVFVRQLTWLLGSGPVPGALVLAAYMTGLALGALVLGRVADRVRRPLALYGGLEIATGVSGLGLAWLLGSGRDVLLGALRGLGDGAASRAIEGTLAFGLLLVPTALMGGSLPALGRWAVRRPGTLLAPLGALYAVNTLGGAAGVLLAGFVLIERLGVAGTAYAAGLLDVAVGATALALARRATPGPRFGPAPPPSRSPAGPAGRAAGLLAAAAGGFAVLGYEVAWTRLLTLPMRSFTYSFSLMLALFLLGLVLGSALVGALARRRRPTLRLLGWSEVAMGAWAATSVVWMPALLAPPETGASFTAFLLSAAARAGPVVLPVTLASGMALPLAAEALAPRLEHLGREVGVAWSVNTAAAVAGALVAGLVLLPAVGAPRTLVLLGTVNAAAGVAVLVLGRAGRASVVLALAAVAVAACGLLVPGARFVEAFLAATRSRDTVAKVLFFDEGATDTVAVVARDYGYRDPDAKSLVTNGVAMSATVKPVWRYMAVEGHLPVLAAASPRRALAIGVGTGITLAAVVSHPEVESIDAVELSDGVVAALPRFADANRRAWQDPRVRLRREDGRHFLETTTGTYDLVTVEPPPPIVAGAVHLYSSDFYESVKRHLAAGGVLAQWLPLHAQSLASARMTAATFLAAFPDGQLWLPSVRDAVLLGGAGPIALDAGRIARAWATPATRADLVAAYLETPETFLGTYLLDAAALRRWAAGAPIVTDDRPRLEFFRTRGANMTDRDIGSLLGLADPDWGFVAGLDRDPELAARVERESEALRAYVGSRAYGETSRGVLAARLALGTEFYLYGFGCATAQTAPLRGALDDRTRPDRARLAEHLEQCARLDALRGTADRGP